MSENLSVRLFADMVYGYSRGVLRGIVNYAKVHGGWDFKYSTTIEDNFTESFTQDHIRGVIIQIRQARQAEKLLASGVPSVNIANNLLKAPPLPCVFANDMAAGAMAADYFLARGFVNFAYCGLSERRFSQLRGDGFRATLEKAGHSCAMMQHSPEQSCAIHLEGLAKPLAVFCCNDFSAKEVVTHAVAMGMKVPDQMSILGVDNDEINCELCGVQLSSIRLNTELIGYEAAGLLAKLIAGKPAPTEPVLIEPVEVITRRSTDMLVLDDPDVAAVVRFIRDRGGREINVADLLQQTKLSRRSLEMRFRKALGRSPYQEIRRVQMERAELLLARTDRPVQEIADACGFKESRQLSVAFHDRLGLTPRQYRHKSRPMNRT